MRSLQLPTGATARRASTGAAARGTSGAAARRGTSLLELSVTAGILVVVLLAVFTLMQRDVQLSTSTLGIQVAETRAQQMLYDLQRELADARGANPVASVTEELLSNATDELVVDSTLGFPDEGTLLVERGTSREERLDYARLTADRTTFAQLSRGLQCTQPASHAAGVELVWAGLAEVLEQQDPAPDPENFDGLVDLPGRNLYFRGDGTGFSYRVPTDPAGGTAYLDGDVLRWGATVAGQPTLDAWACLHFVPRYTYSEAETGDDINRDGDTTDVFDIGQLRRRTWNTTDPGVPASDLGLGPSVVVQERCNWGGDLDGDGFDDPIFLWDRDSRQLHVRLLVLGRAHQNLPIVRRVEATIFLRNEAAAE